MSPSGQPTGNQASSSSRARTDNNRTSQQARPTTNYLPDLVNWVKNSNAHPLPSVECAICGDPIGVTYPDGESVYSDEPSSVADKRKLTFGHLYSCQHIVCRTCSVSWLINRPQSMCPYCRADDPQRSSMRLQATVNDAFRQYRGQVRCQR
ncbi:hypothetical protein PgNI_11091 [Pyricularia grisea]|uniref:RING-type domain-containing protein n=1 Tax=Pyricularia grisea TaxID=148305 RepID=A0A6P8AY93_PYRGI|nr:hypothetical protein PgNI_11091 [Pyricularia grisea]TLD07328.1 hypothetical protein PgNI_11091 [Pyricularia grisea]